VAETVTVNVSQSLVPTTAVGFGVVLVPSPNAAWSGSLVRSYASEADMLVDYSVATMPERAKMRAWSSQSQHGAALKFARVATKPTTVYTLSAVAPTSKPLYAYQVRVAGHGFAETLVSYTSDGTPTDAEYAAGMVSALNAVAGKNYTAAGATSPITITGSSPGAWFAVEVLDPDTQVATETTADPGVAADLAAAFLEDPDFYFVDPIPGSKAYVVACATWVQANSRMMLAGVSDSQVVTAAPLAVDDVADRVKTNGLTRTGVLYHRAPQAMAASAWLGDVSPSPPGSVNFAHKVLAGVPGYRPTTMHEQNAFGKNASIYTRNSEGRFVVLYGTAGDGSFLDDTRSIDWLVYTIKRRVAAVQTNNRVVSYDAEGLALIEGAVVEALGLGVDARVVNASFPRTVTMPALADIDAATRLGRTLPAISIAYTRGGAVNKIVINMQVL